jgi:phosphohistidine phosphatase
MENVTTRFHPAFISEFRTRMKTIYLARHAQAARPDPCQSDFSRPLMKSGIESSMNVGNLLLEKGVKPSLIIASNAVRAKETARILARSLGYPESKIMFEPKIYHCSKDDLYDIISSLPDDLTSVMLVGHNPSMTEFAILLQAGLQNELPVSGVVGISADTPFWHSLLGCKKWVNFAYTSTNGVF